MRWTSSNKNRLAVHRKQNKGQLPPSDIVTRYKTYIMQNDTNKRLAKRLGFSVSKLQNDFKILGLKKVVCRKYQGLHGCCVAGYQDRYKDAGSREWRELGEA